MIGPLLFLVVLPLIPAALPRRWAYFGLGIAALVAGLFWLAIHVVPFSQSDDHGFSGLLLVSWLAAGTVSLSIVAVRSALARSVAPRRPGLWPLPVGILGGVFFMHWLSNRLAGATPAEWVHILVALSGLIAAGTFAFFRPLDPTLRDLSHTAVVLGVIVAFWPINAAYEAGKWARQADLEAKGQPYCILTYAGREHPRPAKSVLELSRLVSRSGGRHAAEDAYWLVIETTGGVIEKRWNTLGGAIAVVEQKRTQPPACTPLFGGNLASD